MLVKVIEDNLIGVEDGPYGDNRGVCDGLILILVIIDQDSERS